MSESNCTVTVQRRGPLVVLTATSDDPGASPVVLDLPVRDLVAALGGGRPAGGQRCTVLPLALARGAVSSAQSRLGALLGPAHDEDWQSAVSDAGWHLSEAAALLAGLRDSSGHRAAHLDGVPTVTGRPA